MSDKPRTTLGSALTAVVVLGLVIDAFVHIHLASAFAENRSRWLSQPTLFRAEATASLVGAVSLVARRNRYTILLAFLLALSGTFAVVFHRYVDLGTVGPIPNMYDP